MDIESMEVGRTLDALIAEKVMGWTRYPEKMHPTDNRTIDGVLYCPPDYPYDRNAANVVPYFSTDLAASFQVVERYVKARIRFTMEYLVDYGADKKIGWCVDIDGVAVTEFCESLPLAICLAALDTLTWDDNPLTAIKEQSK